MQGHPGTRKVPRVGRRLRAIAPAFLIAMAVAAVGASPVAAAAPANDSIENAVVIGALPFEHAVSTREATGARSDPDCFGHRHSVWYRFRPDRDMRVTMVADTTFDGTLSVYTGPRTDLTQVACADDPEALVLDVTAGTTYRIMLATYDGAEGGPATVTVDEFRPPTFQVRVASARLHERTGDVTVRGRMRCADAFGAGINGVLLRQRMPSGRIIEGWSSQSGGQACDGEWVPWKALVLGDRAFHIGWARVVVNLTICDILQCAERSAAAVVWVSEGR